MFVLGFTGIWLRCLIRKNMQERYTYVQVMEMCRCSEQVMCRQWAVGEAVTWVRKTENGGFSSRYIMIDGDVVQYELPEEPTLEEHGKRERGESATKQCKGG